MEILEYIRTQANISNRNSFDGSIKKIEDLYIKFVSSMKNDNKEIIDKFDDFDFNDLMNSIESSKINVNNIPYDSITKFIFSIDTPFVDNDNKIEIMPNNFTTFFKGAFETFLKRKYKKSKIISHENQITEDEKQIKNLMNLVKYSKSSLANEYNTEKIKEDIKVIEVVYKIIDHLNLAIEQKTGLYDKQKIEIEDLSKDLENFSKIVDDENEKMKIVQNKYINLENSLSKIYTDFVAILGIFASIIFGVFGGFQEIQLIGKNLNTTPIPKLLIFSSLVMLGVTLIIFLCFNAVSKLTNMPLRSCNCEIGKCNCSFRKRHPTIFYSSCIYLYTLLVGFALRLYKYNDFTINNVFKNEEKQVEILPLLLLSTPIWLVLLIIVRRWAVNPIIAKFRSKDSKTSNK
ncbi:hypothetical protein [Staphylococcus hominis]|uniref:hypothetical protein n=1 Tax=Staphylococcus hominis TaxID=1290 RepID=UPI003D010B96